MAKIKLHQLTQDFYDEHSHLTEIADKNSNGNLEDKGRGYGVLMIEIKVYQFAIPLRSKMKHKENFPTKIYTQHNKKYRKGLDYTKAIIITDPRFVSHRSFKIPQDEFLKIVNSENRIIQSFEKYVNRYVQAYNTGDENILRKYQFSTLQNYHTELECVSNYSEQQTS
ncbi:type III toxin-antitoxin system TenpIN family toxin [Streptomyces mirabilis]|uniref:type III toxin-antitoxin system TenpIN family toxin n=1 Tax=Streptomyces mirabilis TaxID=68239 RepID=UPI0036997021